MKIKKIAATSKGKVELLEVEIPDAKLAADEIEGGAVSSVISPGTETAVALGLCGGFPLGLGYAMVFRVEKCGSEVKDFKPGNLAFCMRNHESFHRAKAADCVRVPEGLDATVAPFARLMGISMSTLATTTARPPNIIIITGLGIVGNLAAQIFQRCGYDVYAVEPNEARRKMAEDCGVKKILPAMPLTDPKINEKVRLVVDCSGHEAAVLDALKIVGQRGEVVLLGVPWSRKTEIYAYEAFHAVFHKYAVLRSGWEWEVPVQPVSFKESSMLANFKGALSWLKEGSVSVNGIYDVAKPAEAGKIYETYIKGKPKYLTTVFDWKDV